MLLNFWMYATNQTAKQMMDFTYYNEEIMNIHVFQGRVSPRTGQHIGQRVARQPHSITLASQLSLKRCQLLLRYLDCTELRKSEDVHENLQLDDNNEQEIGHYQWIANISQQANEDFVSVFEFEFPKHQLFAFNQLLWFIFVHQ